MIAEPQRPTSNDEHPKTDTQCLRPSGSRLLVRFTETAEKTSGGVWLPGRMQVNTSEATVLAAGAGRLTAEGERFPPWPRAGDIVTFAPEKAQALGDGEALIDAEDVIGLVRSDGSLYPLSDWVQVIPDPKAHESKGGIRLSDRVQRYRIRGTVLEYGPGLLEVEGTCAVRRRTVHEILNLPPDFDLSGRDVFWKRDARVVQLGREQVECWLVSAGDLIGYLE